MSRKKLFSFLTLLIAVITLSTCKSESIADRDVLETSEDSNEIIWGVKNDTRLFGLMDISSQEVKGFDIDMAKAITEKILGRDGQATFVEVTSKTRIPLLKNGNINAIIATMTISEERRKEVDFSDVYFDAGQSLLVEKGSPITDVESIEPGMTILAVKGSTSTENIREHSPEANVIELENYAEAFTALQAGQGDAMTTDNAILLGMASENPNYELVGGTFTNEPYGIAVDKNQENFLNAINDALKEMHEDGTYDELYEKWFPDDDEGRVSE
ncbi:transporter substrate-binding domain-containing protein [Tetragenococcus koreensis]|uniref:transporter substrate-binding domain-containing protein n=1 Tax=Tetragenococcus koreensis TaxID=290335 RepID=UPI001F29E4FB|nr:transporter substrate-binding domain-containing protein [Tetragenococcus koreensis]MCF1585519.1 transporter substrate-binding domain-containing protein [Tetragenococcus koreensis]MCF1629785.1 transporter substrate-binding domain-containing protein [Tetragenococcus koreensis]MCF1642666.1 transporter substrate-binding domain-containing protein [Tetragenococcus koreensis]MDN6290293.1 transporter substrate-binding domain-containing protein [Tetragenococcus koreensis]MDN6343314.1 transporter sub